MPEPTARTPPPSSPPTPFWKGLVTVLVKAATWAGGHPDVIIQVLSEIETAKQGKR